MLGPTHIRVDDLVKTFALPTGAFVAVDRMRFEVREGEFFCLVGPSGCGKTTVLRILAGLETKSGGEVTIHYRQAERPRTAMVFQEQSIYPWMTVEGNVSFALRSRPLGSAAARRDGAARPRCWERCARRGGRGRCPLATSSRGGDRHRRRGHT